MMFLSFFLLFFVPFFVYGVECFFFSQMIRCNTNIVRGELIDGFCVKQLALAVTKFSIDKIVRQVLILMILYPRYQDIKGTNKAFGNSDASSNS